jgi:hypothetical protein
MSKQTENTDNNTEQNGSRVSRREIIALAAAASAAGAGGIYTILSDRDREPTEQRPTPDQIDGENIREYGAEPNPDDPSGTAAQQNLDAIMDAATAAGRDGQIYVPSGVYYFGHDGSGVDQYLDFGEREPAGISIVGDGPEKSVLAVTEHADPEDQPLQSGPKWSDGHDHGTINIANIRLDGNYENLGNLREAGGGSWGLQVNGGGELHLYNAHLRGWHLASVRGGEIFRSAKYCTFEDNGIGNHNDTSGDSISHHISCKPKDGTEVLVENCKFLDCAGSAINIRYDDGIIRLHNCYVEGTGANLCKLSAGKLFELRNVYHKAYTRSLESKMVDREGDALNFYGKNFIQSLDERGEEQVTVDAKNVLTEDIREYAIQARNAPVNMVGDMIAVRNSNMRYDDHVIRNRDEGIFRNLQLDRLSVHDSNAEVFGLRESEGTIKTLRRHGNEGLGDTGNVTISNDLPGKDSFRPDVPSKDQVGINSFDNSIF